MRFLSQFKTLSKFEFGLWLSSIIIITISFFASNSSGILTYIASLIGATALIFVSKGNVLGQILTVVFSLFYAYISFSFRYYGEMITYLGMTAPIAIMSVISWLKHPYEEGKAEVEIAKLNKKQIVIMVFLSVIVTSGFYFVLKFFGNNSMLFSTISITTSFLASYLMMYRSPYYALAYGMNDIVLIILWVIATIDNMDYLPMVICFIIFFINDSYGFINWKKMMKKQNA